MTNLAATVLLRLSLRVGSLVVCTHVRSIESAYSPLLAQLPVKVKVYSNECPPLH